MDWAASWGFPIPPQLRLIFCRSYTQIPRRMQRQVCDTSPGVSGFDSFRPARRLCSPTRPPIGYFSPHFFHLTSFPNHVTALNAANCRHARIVFPSFYILIWFAWPPIITILLYNTTLFNSKPSNPCRSHLLGFDPSSPLPSCILKLP